MGALSHEIFATKDMVASFSPMGNWVDKTAVRAFGVNYVNTTGRTIDVAIRLGQAFAGAASYFAYVDGICVGLATTQNPVGIAAYFRVPVGSTYKFVVNGAYGFNAPPETGWAEA
ncbi:MAG: hypothetical protein EPO42_13260 [Gallionellaceae bacterium]|nr:MAG: hypothetical protein EPO42_13260 [Gallionellaceae bacterium]